MKVYEKVYATTMPNMMEYDDLHIYVNSNIIEATEEEKIANGFSTDITLYSFTMTVYKKSEYTAGLKLANKQVQIAPDSVTVAKKGAEVFNDYRNREYDENSQPTKGNIATGKYAHSEGEATSALGECSHSEGIKTCTADPNSSESVTPQITEVTQDGYAAHSEGFGTVAKGLCSHAEGHGTLASGA